MTTLRWRRLCLGVILSVILLYLKHTFSLEDQQRELRKSVEVTRVTKIVPTVSPQDVITKHVYSHSRPTTSPKTLHSSNTSICRDPGSLPSHLEARRLRLRKVCTSLKRQSPLLRRRRLTTYLLTKLRWDILHHILYCPVPQVGLPWTRYMLGSLGVGNSSVAGNDVDVLLGRRLPSPSLEALEVFALDDGVRVMVARHPFSRLASTYLSLMKEANRTHASESPAGTKSGYSHSQTSFALPASFREFCNHVTHTIEQWVASPQQPPPDPRWMPITYLCSPCTVNYNIISNVECFESDVKFINGYCGLHGEARDARSEERPSLQRPGHTKETHDPAEEDDRAHCMEENKNESPLTEVKKEGRNSNSSSADNSGMGSSVRALFSQLSKKEVDRLYRVYQYDFYLLQYRSLQ